MGARRSRNALDVDAFLRRVRLLAHARRRDSGGNAQQAGRHAGAGFRDCLEAAARLRCFRGCVAARDLCGVQHRPADAAVGGLAQSAGARGAGALDPLSVERAPASDCRSASSILAIKQSRSNGVVNRRVVGEGFQRVVPSAVYPFRVACRGARGGSSFWRSSASSRNASRPPGRGRGVPECRDAVAVGEHGNARL
jgi:hypothetical protein